MTIRKANAAAPKPERYRRRCAAGPADAFTSGVADTAVTRPSRRAVRPSQWPPRSSAVQTPTSLDIVDLLCCPRERVVRPAATVRIAAVQVIGTHRILVIPAGPRGLDGLARR